MFRDRNPGGWWGDDRGLSIGIIGFVAMIVIAALLYTLMEPAASLIFDTTSSQATNADVTDAIALREQIFGGLLFFALFLSGLMLIARSVRESGRIG